MEDHLINKMDEWLATKSYHELDDQEKAIVHQYLGDESDYEKLSALIKPVIRDNMSVGKNIKQSLIAQMKAKHQSRWSLFLSYRIPAYVSALLLVTVGLLTYVLIPPERVTVEKVVMVPAEPIIDTVMLVSKPDTIFIERIIEKKVPVYIVRNEEPQVTEPTKKTMLSGKSLAQQAELRDLLSRSK